MAKYIKQKNNPESFSVKIKKAYFKNAPSSFKKKNICGRYFLCSEIFYVKYLFRTNPNLKLHNQNYVTDRSEMRMQPFYTRCYGHFYFCNRRKADEEKRNVLKFTGAVR